MLLARGMFTGLGLLGRIIWVQCFGFQFNWLCWLGVTSLVCWLNSSNFGMIHALGLLGTICLARINGLDSLVHFVRCIWKITFCVSGLLAWVRRLKFAGSDLLC